METPTASLPPVMSLFEFADRVAKGALLPWIDELVWLLDDEARVGTARLRAIMQHLCGQPMLGPQEDPIWRQHWSDRVYALVVGHPPIGLDLNNDERARLQHAIDQACARVVMAPLETPPRVLSQQLHNDQRQHDRQR